MALFQTIKNWFRRDGLYNVEVTPEANPFVLGMDPADLYASQANLQAVVSFISRSVAQLPLKVYRRTGEDDRERDRTSDAARALWKPNADQTSYELWDGVMTEYLLYGTAIILHLPDPNSESGHQLRIIPKEWIIDTESSTAYAYDSITIKARGNAPAVKIPRTDFVQFKMYAPGNPGNYQSPISALKQTLTEQIQADKFRTKIWSSSGRFNAYITRPKDVQPWDDATRKKWLEAFREGWGAGGSNAGKMPLLEDGMDIKPYQFNAQQAQYAETKQLSREDVAAAYHINPSLIWHTTTQTYASAKDNARALYNDCLGPDIQMLQQRINSFLLPMLGASPETFVVFDLTEKLKGSFEERASILQSAVGGPYMTRNEARADNDLPPIEGGDQLIVPLNVNNGIDNPAVEEEAPAEERSGGRIPFKYFRTEKSDAVMIKGWAEDAEREIVIEVVRKFMKRQAASIRSRLGAGRNWWSEDRWNDELAEDLLPIIQDITERHGNAIAKELGTEYWLGQTINYLKAMAEGRAKAINTTTKRNLDEALEIEDEEEREEAVDKALEERENAGAEREGYTIATIAVCWALQESTRQAREEQGSRAKVTKTWRTGENPRPDHAAMNGETVDIEERFSNGANWPGDDILGPEGTCFCNCTTEINITRRR